MKILILTITTLGFISWFIYLLTDIEWLKILIGLGFGLAFGWTASDLIRLIKQDRL